MRFPCGKHLAAGVMVAVLHLSASTARANLATNSLLARDSLFLPLSGSLDASTASAEPQTLGEESRGHAPWTALAICAAPSWRWLGSKMIPDGQQGAILAWYDARSAATTQLDIYVQRIGPSGEARWTANGVPVCTAPGDQYNEVLVSDGTGGAILAWTDGRPGGAYSQRVNADGTVAWTLDGVRLTETEAITPAIAQDDQGGALVVWEDWTGGPRKIRAQRVDPLGRLLWGGSGVGVCTVLGLHYGPKICPDGSGGAYIAWTDQRGPVSQVFVQHIAPSGIPLWADQGVPVFAEQSEQRAAGLVADTDGRAVVIWADARTRPPGSFGLFAQRLASSGARLWQLEGVALSEETVSENISLDTVRDGKDLIALWHERRGSNFDAYAQRLDPNGNRLLGAAGIAVADGPGDQIYPRVVLGRDHGLIVGWTDVRYAPFACFLAAQETEALGTRNWGATGVELARIPGDNEQALTTDGRGGAFAGWVACCPADSVIQVARLSDARSRVATTRATVGPDRATRPSLEAHWSRSESSLRLVMAQGCDVDAAIYDLSGRAIRRLLHGHLKAGTHSIAWDQQDGFGKTVASGIYFAGVRTGCGSQTIRIPIMK